MKMDTGLQVWAPLAVVALVATLTGCAADLRGDTLAGLKEPAPEREARGRALLDGLAERYGEPVWAEREGVELIMRDDWDSVLAELMSLEPWDEEDLLQIRYQPGDTSNIRVDFIEGPRRGEMLVVQAGATYRQKGLDSPVELTDDRNVRSMLPTLAHLAELPFRLARAPVVLYDSERTHAGQTYDTVLVTWGGPKPNAHDQYLLWLNRETGVLDLVDFTVRRQGRFSTSRVFYTGVEAHGGVHLPRELIVTDVGADIGARYLHKVTIERVRFDSFSAALLHPNATQAFVGDDKP